MKKFLIAVAIGSLSVFSASSQVLLSGGLTYSQNFDTLANSPDASQPSWADGTTLTGWYASRSFTGGTATPFGPYAYITYRVGAGTANNGWIWSFGIIGNSDRALGSIGSGTPKTNAIGVLIQNDTANAVDTVTVSYTGEQWRNGGNTAVNPLSFSYKTYTSPFAGVLETSLPGWTTFSSLDFVSPTTGATASALDGNLAANRTVIGPTVLTGVTLNPGEQIFLRWLDVDETGNDHGIAIDDLTVSFSAVVPEPTVAVLGGLAALGMILRLRNRH